MRWIVFLLFIFTSSSVYNQNYSITSYGEEQGLVQGSVYCINQDERGLIWVATDQGLYQFNGHSFKHFGIKDGLSDHEIFGLAGDSKDFFFITTFKGKLNYYSKGKIYNPFNDSFLSKLDLPGIHTVSKVSNNRFVLSAINGKSFYIITTHKGRVNNTKRIHLPKGKCISSLRILSSKIIVQCQDSKGLYPLFSSRRIYDQYGNFLDQIGYKARESYNFLLPDSSLIILSIDNGEVRFINRKNLNGPILFEGKHNSNIYAVQQYGPDIWLATRNGVIHYSNHQYQQTLFKDLPVNYIFKDMHGNTWIGTEGGGLKLLRKHHIQFVESPEKITTSHFLRNGTLVLGYNKSAYGTFPKSNTSNSILLNNGINTNVQVRDITSRKNGDVMIATDQSLFLNKANGRTLPLLTQYKYIYGSIKCIRLIKNKLLLGSSEGLFILDIQTEKFRKIYAERVVSISLGPDSNIWVGVKSGLIKFSFTNWKHSKVIGGELQRRRVNHMSWHGKSLYLATDSGIFTLSRGKSKCIATESSGLLSNNCFKVRIYEGFIWVATPSGLCRITPGLNGNKVETYTITDGLASNYICDIQLRNDSVYVSNTGGLNVFNIHQPVDRTPPKINILGFHTSDSIYNTFMPIIVKAGDQTSNIQYAAVSYGRPCNYKYRLREQSENWNLTSKGVISFSNLEPGHYTFEVIAISANGVPSTQSALLSFTVSAFFYQTLWFQLGLLVIFIALITFLLYWRYTLLINRERERNALDKEHAMLELEAIKAQINPHFIYNCLNSIQHSIIMHNNESAEKQLSTFAKLVRETLDYSKTNFITLKQEMQYLEKYLAMEKHRFKDKINFEIITSVDNTKSIMVPSLVIQPYVENAVKYGLSPGTGQLKIRVCFTAHKDRLVCRIEDAGEGITPDIWIKKETPSGMSLSQNRVDTYNTIYNMDIKIKVINKTQTKTYNSGTMILIIFPLKQS